LFSGVLILILKVGLPLLVLPAFLFSRKAAATAQVSFSSRRAAYCTDENALLHFFVFSFNRGEFLANCIRSLERCAPHCGITVVDDNSSDPATLEVLSQVAAKHCLIQPRAAESGKHGGLYANMQTAFDSCADNALFCFLQDDMQLVRSLDEDETARLAGILASAATPCLLQPAFMKGADRRRHKDLIRYQTATDSYCIDRLRHSAGAWYSDILIGHAGRLREVGWRFLPGEAANEQQARHKLGQLLYLKNPFVAWLPNVPAWRGKTRTLGLRLAHKAGNCGFHPLRCLSPEQAAGFTARDPSLLPIAEDWLALCEGSLPAPWRYHPLQGRRVLKLLNSVELKLRRLLH